jgi:hypothetical protein
MLRGRELRNGAPNRETTFMSVVTIATDRNVGEGFRPVELQICNTLDQMTAAHPHHLRNNLAGKRPGKAMDATMTPHANTKPGYIQPRPPDSTTTMMLILQNR